MSKPNAASALPDTRVHKDGIGGLHSLRVNWDTSVPTQMIYNFHHLIKVQFAKYIPLLPLLPLTSMETANTPQSKLSKPFTFILAAGFALAAASTGHAQMTIFQDGFSKTGELNGQTPDVVDTGGATWNTNTGVFTEGTGMLNFTAAQSTGPSFAELAYAGSNFVLGHTYQLSLDTTFSNAPGDRWEGIGLTTGNPGDAFGNGAAWMLNKGTGSDIQYFSNNFGGSGTATGAGSSNTTLAIQLAVSATGTGSLTYFAGGTALNATAPLTLTAGQVSAITGVGIFKYHDAAGTYDNLTFTDLTAAVPEPGTWTMALVGVGALLSVQRFRARKA